jgi:hypothetical protein
MLVPDRLAWHCFSVSKVQSELPDSLVRHQRSAACAFAFGAACAGPVALRS